MAEVKIENIEELEYSNEEVKDIATVQVRLNVRQEPQKGSEVVRILEAGEKVEILAYDGDWAKISDGYCMKEYLK
jgi:uncharacterized protein YgiM (DUF1202 family)